MSYPYPRNQINKQIMEIIKHTVTYLLEKDIIDSRRVNFGLDFETRLIADNSTHQYDSILAYLSPKLLAYKNTDEGIENAYALRSSKTIVTDEDMVIIDKALHVAFKNVDFVSGATSSIGEEIFPGGLAYVNGITKTNISSRMQVIINGFMNHVTLYVGVGASINNLKITYTSDRTIQMTAKSNITIGDNTIDADRLAFCEAFSDAVGDLSKICRQTPGKAGSYWTQSLLVPHAHHNYEHFSGTLAAGESLLISTREFFEKTHVMINSLTLNATISAYILEHAGDPIVKEMSVTGIDSTTKEAHEIGGETGTLLMLKNDSPGPVDYKLDIID